jgi:hypothetical protein
MIAMCDTNSVRTLAGTLLPSIALLGAMGCLSTGLAVRPGSAPTGTGGATSAGGGQGQASVAGEAATPTSSGRAEVALPTPPGEASIPKPAGAAGGLKILDWAGFKSALTYTFDDGQPSQIEHYSELQATGVRMTFFVNSSNSSSPWAERFTDTFARAVHDGHEIGNHTANHCHASADGAVLSQSSGNQRMGCANPTAGQEFDACTGFITTRLGALGVWSSASPFGDPGFAGAASERFFLNRGVMDGTIRFRGGEDPFDLPVWPVIEGDSLARFKSKIDGAHRSGRWMILLLHSIAPTSAGWYATVDISAITGSIAHAKSLGDVWIDTMTNIGAYWRGAKILVETTPSSSQAEQRWTWKLPPHFPPGRSLRVTVDGGTPSQGGKPLTWDAHGYYEISLDAGALSLTP